jgi:hypothetical protein
MATTAQDIVTAAYNTSAKNRPATIATDATELLKLVIRSTRGLYAFAARVNPIYFSDSAPVTFAVIGWPRPTLAESIFRIEKPDGTEVAVVPFDDRKAEPSMPAVYELGGHFWPAGNALDPVSGNLNFWYSRRPTDPATLASNLDTRWPEQFNDLLIYEVAIYLALKDGRAADVAQLRVMRDGWADLFAAHLEHATANLRARFGQVRRFTTNTMVPLKAMLAGGA